MKCSGFQVNADLLSLQRLKQRVSLNYSCQYTVYIYFEIDGRTDREIAIRTNYTTDLSDIIYSYMDSVLVQQLLLAGTVVKMANFWPLAEMSTQVLGAASAKFKSSLSSNCLQSGRKLWWRIWSSTDPTRTVYWSETLVRVYTVIDSSEATDMLGRLILHHWHSKHVSSNS